MTINPWKRTLWSLLLVIFSKDSSQPPGAAHSANKDTLGYVYHSRHCGRQNEIPLLKFYANCFQDRKKKQPRSVRRPESQSLSSLQLYTSPALLFLHFGKLMLDAPYALRLQHLGQDLF